MSSVLSLVALSLLGCKDDVVEDTAPPCQTIVKETFPATDSNTAYYRQLIEVHFSAAAPDATIDVPGVSGSTWFSESEKVLYFEPDSALDPSTGYTFDVTWCDGDSTATVPFTTSSLGTAIDDVSTLNDKTFELNLGADSVRVVVPEGVGSVLEPYLAEVTIFLQIEEATSSELKVFGALGDEESGEQDMCTETLDFPVADFSGAPFFEIGPEDTVISVADITAEIKGLNVTGTFASDGTFWGGGTLAGEVDTRPLVDLIEEGGEEGAVCELVEGFGVDCIDCGDGEAFCLALEAVGLGGDEQTFTLETIEMSDCHEDCPDTADNPDCPLNNDEI